MTAAPALSPADLPVSIARFDALMRTTVAETNQVTWGEALAWLAKRPDHEHSGSNDAGWSAARYEPPKRSKENVREVYGLVLDYDKNGDWSKVERAWRTHYGLLYTTKSHGKADGDRLRAVLPLSRPVTADEYARIWDWAARHSAAAGCVADQQCKDASRFWYEPTIPPGGWRAELLTGAAIDADAILAMPVAEPRPRSVTNPILHTDQKARRAISYLSKIPGAVSGDAGHTRTFNAVAHVMIGFDLDPDQARTIILEHYNPRCDPPWSEREIDHKIRDVAEKCIRDRGYLLQVEREPIRTAAQASDAAPREDKTSADWRTHLQTKSDGRTPRRGVANVRALVAHHPDFAGKWSLNTMTGDVWFDGQQAPESTVHDTRVQIDERLGFSPSREDVEGAIHAAAAARPFHPIQAYLRTVQWDGVPRLSTMAADYLGSPFALDAELVRKWMISAVARAMRPGCKVDTSLMIYGEQGWFKSSFFKTLGGDWHADSPIDISSKDSFQQIHATWIYEFAELENVVHGRAESRLKAWLTSTHDMFRAPYARVVTNKPRCCVICGTTNRRQFLTDETGSRRFWIVEARGPIPRDELAGNRDQLWAEAVVEFEAGRSWWLDRDAERARERVNVEYRDEDAWTENFEAWLTGRAATTIGEVLKGAVGVEAARQAGVEQKRAQKILADLGWGRRRMHGRWVYVRSDLLPGNGSA